MCQFTSADMNLTLQRPPSRRRPARTEYNYSDVGALIGGAEAASPAGQVKTATSVQFVELHVLRGYPASGAAFSTSRAIALLARAIGRNRALGAKLCCAGFLLGDVVALAPNHTEGSSYS